MHTTDPLAKAEASPPPPSLPELFRGLVDEWKREALYLSNPVHIARLAPYQRIIGLGVPAVPLILEELRREPDQWFWALQAITGENPVPPEANGRLDLMTQAWIRWGQERGLIA